MSDKRGPPKLETATRLDGIRLDETYFTPEGFFIDEPVLTRTGIFEYRQPDGSVRRELRLPEHVFDAESLASYEGKPVIITHGPGRVGKGNVADVIVGTVLGRGYKDGDRARAKVVVHDVDSVKRSGLRELSLGYDTVLACEPGEYKGKPYDAVQTKIRVNHLALVREARAGETARLNMDSKAEKGAMQMDDRYEAAKEALAECKKLKKKLEAELAEIEIKAGLSEDGGPDYRKKGKKKEKASYRTADDKKKAAKKEKKDAAYGSPDDKYEAIKAKYGKQDGTDEIGALLEYIDCLKAKGDAKEAKEAKDAEDAEKAKGKADGKPKDKADDESPDEEEAVKADSVDGIVVERMRLGRLGDRLGLEGLEGLRPFEAKKRIIAAALPGMRLDGQSAAYVQAAFDQAAELVESRKDADYQRRQMSQRTDGAPGRGAPSLDARARMVQNLLNGGEKE